jgi:hypothetical protein
LIDRNFTLRSEGIDLLKLLDRLILCPTLNIKVGTVIMAASEYGVKLMVLPGVESITESHYYVRNVEEMDLMGDFRVPRFHSMSNCCVAIDLAIETIETIENRDRRSIHDSVSMKKSRPGPTTGVKLHPNLWQATTTAIPSSLHITFRKKISFQNPRIVRF